ncbi:hypothetical protein C8Q73DRAFT_701918 [Cubamyces lactineus]|nr:hypothetical protein C8Q73DRAFT_701918 [Cubamyces lactineus]
MSQSPRIRSEDCVGSQMDWYINAVGETPCETYQNLRTICDPNYQLPPHDSSTVPPWDFCTPDSKTNKSPCCCNPIAFQLDMLCLNCITISSSQTGVDAASNAFRDYVHNCYRVDQFLLQTIQIPPFISQLYTFGTNNTWIYESFTSSAVAIIASQSAPKTQPGSDSDSQTVSQTSLPSTLAFHTTSVPQGPQGSSSTVISTQTTSQRTARVVATQTVSPASPAGGAGTTSFIVSVTSTTLTYSILSILQSDATPSVPARAASLQHAHAGMPTGTIIGIVLSIVAILGAAVLALCLVRQRVQTRKPGGTKVVEDEPEEPRRNARSTDKFPFLPPQPNHRTCTATYPSSFSFVSLLRRFRTPQTSETLQNRYSASFDPNAMVRPGIRGVSSLRTSSYTEPLPEYGAWDANSIAASVEANTDAESQVAATRRLVDGTPNSSVTSKQRLRLDFESGSDTHTSEE